MLLSGSSLLLLVASALSFSTGWHLKNKTSSEIKTSIQENYNLSSIESLLPRGIPSNNMESYMSTVEIIISRGYHAEMHSVTTDDEYILMLHRIPYPKGRSSGPTGRPVLIQHGLQGSSADFVLLPTEKSIAFILADLGYDVWLSNNRGNTYSRGHVTLDSDHDDAYWKFSFDEMGRYDIPAIITHVLAVTSREKLHYIGFSSGTTVLFVCMHYHPKFNDKIESMVAMAPVATGAKIFFPLQIPLQAFLRLFGDTVIGSSSGIYSKFVKRYCLKNASFAIFCHNALFSIFGPNYGNMNLDLIKVVNYHFPAGTSVRTQLHFAQNSVPFWKNPQFNQFDFGWIGNLKHYGKLDPPAYDLGRMTAPVFIFYGPNDYLSLPKDVRWTASKLPNVKQVVLVDDPRFNHIDFLYSRRAKELVYNQIVALLPPP